MSLEVTVVDYGMGNLFSVSRGIERCGGRVVLADKPEMLDAAEVVILPGVGAFADGMAELRKRGLVDALKKVASDNRPLLGICLGMQMLLDTGKEFGVHEGLGIIPGTVESIPTTGADGRPHKIPHIGWNALVRPAKCATWEDSILAGVPEKSFVYFVHSFTPMPVHEENRLADCYYDGRRISAAIRTGHVFGTQFHPEKSGPIGLHILRNFLALKTRARKS
jgi:glutamine amidotransferase